MGGKLRTPSLSPAPWLRDLLVVYRRWRKSRAASCTLLIATARPACRSLEEVTISTVAPMMGVFNNLVVFDQHVPQNSLQSIMPDLATGWSWSEDGTELTFPLAPGR